MSRRKSKSCGRPFLTTDASGAQICVDKCGNRHALDECVKWRRDPATNNQVLAIDKRCSRARGFGKRLAGSLNAGAKTVYVEE